MVDGVVCGDSQEFGMELDMQTLAVYEIDQRAKHISEKLPQRAYFGLKKEYT